MIKEKTSSWGKFYNFVCFLKRKTIKRQKCLEATFKDDTYHEPLKLVNICTENLQVCDKWKHLIIIRKDTTGSSITKYCHINNQQRGK